MGIDWTHVYAIMVRRLLMHKQGKRALVGTLLPLVLCVTIGIVLEFSVKIGDELDKDPSSFKDFRMNNPLFIMVYTDSIETNPIVQKIKDTTIELIKNDTGVVPNFLRYKTIDEMNEDLYAGMTNSSKNSLNAIIGFKIEDNITDDYLPITLIYNDTSYDGNPGMTASFEQLQRVIWRVTNTGDYEIKSLTLLPKSVTQIMSRMTPMYVFIGLFGMCSLFGKQAIDDIKNQKRPYLIGSKLSIISYWVGTFIIDYGLWLICSTIVWIILYAVGSSVFKDHPGACFFTFVASGISIILVAYCWSFIFKDPEAGASFIMMLLFMPVILIFLIEQFRGSFGDDIVPWIYALYPVCCSYNFLNQVTGSKEDFGKMWTSKETQASLVGMIIDIPIYAIILLIIEWARIKIAQKSTQNDFQNYTSFFEERRCRQNLTEDAIRMAEEVQNSNGSEYAIRTVHVSRLFFDTEKKPIAVVNDVSLGIKRGELFGFLGANGAGKTTLMNIIMGDLPASSGFVEVDGERMSGSDEQKIAICPQFNDHLTPELTPMDTLRLFSRIYKMKDEEFRRFTDELLPLLDLDEHKDKLVRELSGGNARKLAVLVAFMSPASIVMLDEPTSSLDPVSRRNVHELIARFRGQKTFMLCTHLLDEAESLCDKISMMINGCVYAVGEPSDLSAKFGTEWKVDVLLEDSGCSSVVQDFFRRTFPTSKLTIQRPRNLIFSIPTADVEISFLFRTIKEAVGSDYGIKYFTCSSSSLEKVFLELILRSEMEFEDDGIIRIDVPDAEDA